MPRRKVDLTRNKATCLLLVSVSVACGQAGATWSIVAVNPVTREVGAAAAMCTVGVELIQGGVAGKGIIVAQRSLFQQATMC
jgi:hypothetical protein